MMGAKKHKWKPFNDPSRILSQCSHCLLFRERVYPGDATDNRFYYDYMRVIGEPLMQDYEPECKPENNR